jgi:hypothetical protein
LFLWNIYFLINIKINSKERNVMQEKEKSAHDMTDEEVAKSVDLETSDFDDSGDMLDELRDILDGNV